MYQFSITIRKGSNFRPSALIQQYAKSHRLETVNFYGSVCLIIDGILYGYSCYQIQGSGSVFETVTVTMIRK